MWLSNIELIVTNLVVIYLAITQNWDTREILLTYWLQSVIIGIFQFIKILDLQQFAADGVLIGSRLLTNNNQIKRFYALFFLFHYGLFHLVYIIFILTGIRSASPPVSFSALLLPTLIFFVNHLVSFFVNRPTDSNSNRYIGYLMAAPYIRIIPMHLTLIFGFALGLPKLFFLLIRAATDLISHYFIHHPLKPVSTN